MRTQLRQDKLLIVVQIVGGMLGPLSLVYLLSRVMGAKFVLGTLNAGLPSGQGWILMLFGAVIVTLYYWTVWDMAGRDPAKGPAIPLFAPPGSLSPAVLGYMRDMKFSIKLYVAALLNMMKLGAIAIYDDNSSHHYAVIVRGPAGKGVLSVEEEKIYEALLGDRERVDFSEENGPVFMNGLQVCRDWVEAACRGRYISHNTSYVILGSLISGIIFILIQARTHLGLLTLPFVLVLCGINALFYRLMRAPSKEGQRIREAAEGFRLFLGTTFHGSADASQLESIPQDYRSYLPYAIALDAETNLAARATVALMPFWEERANYASWYQMRRDSMEPIFFPSLLMAVAHGTYRSRRAEASAGPTP